MTESLAVAQRWGRRRHRLVYGSTQQRVSALGSAGGVVRSLKGVSASVVRGRTCTPGVVMLLSCMRLGSGAAPRHADARWPWYGSARSATASAPAPDQSLAS